MTTLKTNDFLLDQYGAKGLTCTINSPPLLHQPSDIPSDTEPKRPELANLVVLPEAFAYNFDYWLMQFNKMYSKRTMVHWYVGEGMSEGFFEEGAESVRNLIQDYKEVFTPTIEASDDEDY